MIKITKLKLNRNVLTTQNHHPRSSASVNCKLCDTLFTYVNTKHPIEIMNICSLYERNKLMHHFDHLVKETIISRMTGHH